MSRSEPVVNLNYCESHVILKAILPSGEILRLGTGTLTNIPEEDSLTYSYSAKVLKDSQVRISTTQSANTFSVDAENVDKELGLAINNINTSLQGAKIVASKVFSDPYSMDITSFGPDLWYDVGKLRGALPNDIVNFLPDLSGNGRDANGMATFRWKRINGVNALEFNLNQFMDISGSFNLSHVFAVVDFNEPEFSSSGSVLGSPSSPPFRFATNTSEFGNPLPIAVRSQGEILTTPFSLGDLTSKKILNIKTNSPSTIRQYQLNNQNGARLNFAISELIGFSEQKSPAEEQNIEYILSRKFGIQLPYTPVRTWDRKVLLVGEISLVEVDENFAKIRIVSDIAPNVAFIGARQVGTNCPLVFKGIKCGYSGPLTTCNKKYISEGGCSGRDNQHRFGGVIIEGELNRIIPGGIDTTIGDPSRFGNIELPHGRNREVFLI